MGTYFLAALVVFAVVMAAMAIGVIFRGRTIRGSCGGMSNLRDEKGDAQCFACRIPSEECGGVEEGKSREAAGSGRDADR